MKTVVFEFNDTAEVFYAKLSFYATEYKRFRPFWPVNDYIFTRMSKNRFCLSKSTGRNRYSVIGKIDEQPSGIKITIQHSFWDYLIMTLILIFIGIMALISPVSWNVYELVVIIIMFALFSFNIIFGFFCKPSKHIIELMNGICNF